MNSLLIKIVFLLFPGIVGMFIIESLITKRKINQRNYLASLIIISIFSYFLLYIERYLTQTNFYFFDALLHNNVDVNIREVFYTTIISVILSLIVTYIIKYNLYYRISRKLKLTNRTGGVDIWSDFVNFNGKGINRYIYVVDQENDRVYGGSVEHYSTTSEKSIEMILGSVCVYKNSNRKKHLYDLNRMYINLPKDKVIIEEGDEYESTDKKRTKRN